MLAIVLFSSLYWPLNVGGATNKIAFFVQQARRKAYACRMDFCAGSNRSIEHAFELTAYKKRTDNYVRCRLWKSQKSQLERVKAKNSRSEHKPVVLRVFPLPLQRDNSYENA
jgi:hypothetical protein